MKVDQPSLVVRSPLVLGVSLLVIGGVLLASNLGYFVPSHLWQYWPRVLIVVGIVSVAFPSRHLSRLNGVWLLATGIFGEVGMHRHFGLGWTTAWPIFVIAAGFNIIFEARSNYRQNDRVIHE